ncbi:MAG: hypothetical protein IJM79_01705 [Erysipelotrichaceae bacterium]|nr:hypothetical protein [Erysipelotrichaceae bacterium]
MKKTAATIICVIMCLLMSGCGQKESDPVAYHLDDRGGFLTERKYLIEEQKLTLDQKIGQLLFVEYRRTAMDEKLEKMLETVQPGGFILFGENFSTYEKTLKLVKDVKSCLSIPLFVGCDEEGGRVQRISSLKDRAHPTYDIPTMRSVGNKGDLGYAEKMGQTIGAMCRVFGINMDFAPVADIVIDSGDTIISTRAFGSDSKLVAEMASALGRGLQNSGVMPVYKHFPGHGSSAQDSHLALAVNQRTMAQIEQFELLPFRKAVEEGAPAIMVGHIALKDLHEESDEDYLMPATLDKAVITGILREQMGFEGLVITDSLQMNGLKNTRYKTDADIAQAALEAGCDMLLCPKDALKLFEQLKERIENGQLDVGVVDRAVTRILKYKHLYIWDIYDEYYDAQFLSGK